MNTGTKIANGFCIFLAWILSIALVVLLIAAPVIFSALELLDGETIANALTGSAAQWTRPSYRQETGIRVTTLSGTTKAGGIPDLGDIGAGLGDIQFGDIDISQIDPGVIEDIIGEAVEQEVFDKVISSDVANELVEAYTQDFINSMTGAPPEFNAEKIKKIVTENIDEAAELLAEINPEFENLPVDEITAIIEKGIDEFADDIIEVLPKPEQIVQDMVTENADLAILVEILAHKKEIKQTLLAAIVVLAVLVFVLRLFGIKGFRWLATDLFIATGFNAIISAALLLGGSAISGLAAAQPFIGNLVGSFVSDFTNGVVWRTAAMLGSAVVLLIVHFIVKSVRTKKQETDQWEAEFAETEFAEAELTE